MKVTFMRVREHQLSMEDFQYQPQQEGERPVVLDVLLQYQTQQNPDYAYRYGCRNGLCGVCTVEVNGRPRLACKCRANDGDKITPLTTLPVLTDLVVSRAAVNKQLMNRLPVIDHTQADCEQDNAAYHSLNRCIECYACLHQCPLHEKNDIEHIGADYKFGNPYSFLKLQRVANDANASAEDKKQAQQVAVDLGIEQCADCQKCRCGIGIKLVDEVIQPLLKSTETELQQQEN